MSCSGDGSLEVHRQQGEELAEALLQSRGVPVILARRTVGSQRQA